MEDNKTLENIDKTVFEKYDDYKYHLVNMV